MLDRNSDGVDFDVCVVGLGYVGLTLATAFAHHGLLVAGTERVPAVVETLRRGDSSFYEQGLSEVLTDVVARRQLQVFAADEPLPKAGAYVITVGTPLRDGEVHFTDLENALDTVATQMPAGALIVLRSTVRIGITENTAKPVLDRAGKPYLLAMAPERTVEGRALQELSSLPQVVGGIDAASTAAANELFSHPGVEIVEVGNTKAAEFAKLVSNTWRDLQFGFANELAYLADASGVDIYEVITAASYKYDRLKLALPGPVAGPCLEKDAYILADSAQFFDTEVPLSLAGRSANEKIVTHVGQTAQVLIDQPQRAAIIGLAFKGRPATSDTRGSLAGNFAGRFRELWPALDVVGWDPLVSPEDSAEMNITFTHLPEAVSGANLVLLQSNHPDFTSEQFVEVLAAKIPDGAVVIDLWNQTEALAKARPDLKIAVLGRLSEVNK